MLFKDLVDIGILSSAYSVEIIEVYIKDTNELMSVHYIDNDGVKVNSLLKRYGKHKVIEANVAVDTQECPVLCIALDFSEERMINNEATL